MICVNCGHPEEQHKFTHDGWSWCEERIPISGFLLTRRCPCPDWCDNPEEKYDPEEFTE